MRHREMFDGWFRHSSGMVVWGGPLTGLAECPHELEVLDALGAGLHVEGSKAALEHGLGGHLQVHLVEGAAELLAAQAVVAVAIEVRERLPHKFGFSVLDISRRPGFSVEYQ